jgi:S-formylglutathione hydrolase FrmB
MGGYGALLAAEIQPGGFAAVAVASPAIWTSYAAQHGAVPDAFDGPADDAAHDVLARTARLRRIPIRVDSGDADPFLPGMPRPDLLAAGRTVAAGLDAARARLTVPREGRPV